MARKRHNPQVDVLTAEGKSIGEALKARARPAQPWRQPTEAPRRKWPMIDVSFLADFPELEREIGHEEEAVFS
jgi:hypothetical protein